MKVKVFFNKNSPVLNVFFFDYNHNDEKERGRLARIEIDLLRKLSHFESFPVLKVNGHFLYRLQRQRSTSKDMETIKDILRGYCLESE